MTQKVYAYENQHCKTWSLKDLKGFKGKELGCINVKQFLYYNVHLRQEYVIFVYLYNTISWYVYSVHWFSNDKPAIQTSDIQIIFLRWTRDEIYIKRHISVELENSWRAHMYISIGIKLGHSHKLMPNLLTELYTLHYGFGSPNQ